MKHHDSAFFTNDFRILKNATYGKPNPAELAEKKLREQFGDFDGTGAYEEYGDSPNRNARVPEVNVSFQQEESKG